MTLRYLLDEHLRGPPWRAIQWHNRLGEFPLDVVRVGDPPDLPLGALDPDMLVWAEREGRVLVSRDRDTLASHLAAHLSAGRHSPGIFLIRRRVSLPELVSFLVEAAYASEAVEWADRRRTFLEEPRSGSSGMGGDSRPDPARFPRLRDRQRDASCAAYA
jgi:Domain of unknown function (DUF5615)